MSDAERDIVDRLLDGESCNRDAAREIVKLRTAVLEMFCEIHFGRSRKAAKRVADMHGPKWLVSAQLLNGFHKIDLAFDAPEAR